MFICVGEGPSLSRQVLRFSSPAPQRIALGCPFFFLASSSFNSQQFLSPSSRLDSCCKTFPDVFASQGGAFSPFRARALSLTRLVFFRLLEKVGETVFIPFAFLFCLPFTDRTMLSRYTFPERGWTQSLARFSVSEAGSFSL